MKYISARNRLTSAHQPHNRNQNRARQFPHHRLAARGSLLQSQPFAQALWQVRLPHGEKIKQAILVFEDWVCKSVSIYIYFPDNRRKEGQFEACRNYPGRGDIRCPSKSCWWKPAKNRRA